MAKLFVQRSPIVDVIEIKAVQKLQFSRLVALQK